MVLLGRHNVVSLIIRRNLNVPLTASVGVKGQTRRIRLTLRLVLIKVCKVYLYRDAIRVLSSVREALSYVATPPTRRHFVVNYEVACLPVGL